MTVSGSGVDRAAVEALRDDVQFAEGHAATSIVRVAYATVGRRLDAILAAPVTADEGQALRRMKGLRDVLVSKRNVGQQSTTMAWLIPQFESILVAAPVTGDTEWGVRWPDGYIDACGKRSRAEQVLRGCKGDFTLVSRIKAHEVPAGPWTAAGQETTAGYAAQVERLQGELASARRKLDQISRANEWVASCAAGDANKAVIPHWIISRILLGDSLETASEPYGWFQT